MQRRDCGRHLAQNGLVVNASVDNGTHFQVLLVLLALLDRDMRLLQIIITRKALHPLRLQVTCKGSRGLRGTTAGNTMVLGRVLLHRDMRLLLVIKLARRCTLSAFRSPANSALVLAIMDTTMGL